MQAQPKLDSLARVTKNRKLPEKERISAFLALAQRYINTHPDSAMYYAEQLLTLATASKNLAGQGLAMDMKSNVYQAKNQPQEAFNSLYKGLGLCQQASDSNCLVRILYNLGYLHLESNNLDSTAYYYQQALVISKALNNPKLMIAPISGLGAVARDKGNLEEALSYYKEAAALMEQENQRASLGDMYYNLAFIYAQTGDYKKGAEYCKRSIDVYEMQGNKAKMASALNGLGLIAYYQTDYSEALANFGKAMSLHKETNNSTGLATVLGNRGMIYSNQGNTEKALENYNRSLKIHQEYENAYGVGTTLNIIGSLYIEQEDYTLGLQYLQEGLAVFDSIEYRIGKPGILQKIVYTYVRLGEDSLAFEIASEGLKLSREMGLKREEANILIELGELYQNRGEYPKAQQNLLQALKIDEGASPNSASRALNYLARLHIKQKLWKEARKYAQKGLTLAQKTENLRLIYNAAEALWESQQALGQYRDALENYQLFIKIQDSLKGIENQRATIRFEYQQKALADSLNSAKTLALQVAETSRRTTVSYLLLGGLLVALVLGFLLWNRFRLTRKQNQIIEEEKTKLDHAYSELNVANEKLKEADLSKSRFFTNISHEFRTPLTVIGGMINQIKEKPDQWLIKGSEIITRNVHNLRSLINQILDLRKLESGQLTLSPIQADVVKFLRLGVASFESLAESKNINLTFFCEESEIIMDFDPQKLGQIQANLISNALKFTPSGGDINLEIGTKNTDTFEFKLSDTGMGIPANKLPMIFDRFYQIDESDTREGEGTGIGLALVKEFTQLMKGNIQVESKIAEGTQFVLTLPITHQAPIQTGVRYEPIPMILEPNKKEASIFSSPTLVSGERPNLLIVEDNPDIVEYLFACLEDDYEISTARDGEAGIEMALERIPDIIISDVMMPKKDGFELCKTLKTDEKTSHIPIILLTAKADFDSKLTGLGLGADVYLSKPFEKRELLIQLQNLIQVRKNLQKRYQSGEPLKPVNNPITQKQDAFILKAQEIIQEHLDDHDFNIPAFCREIGMSRAQLHRKMKALTNLSTSLFIQNIRLEKANHLLETTSLSVAEISDMTGHSSSSYFSNLYKKKYGISPGKKRKKST